MRVEQNKKQHEKISLRRGKGNKGENGIKIHTYERTTKHLQDIHIMMVVIVVSLLLYFVYSYELYQPTTTTKNMKRALKAPKYRRTTF